MILLTGAGGKTGRALLKSLAGGKRVRALVYRPEQAAAAVRLGAAQVVVGDLRDPSVVARAVGGIASVYHISPNMHPAEFRIGAGVIQEAANSGVDRFVYHSVLHPQTEKMNHHWQKLRVEEMLLESGLSFTILQPATYMQNLLAGWRGILDEGIIRVPYSVESRFSFVDLEDVADAARLVLDASSHSGATYELAGTAPLSHAEIARIAGTVLHRSVRAEEQSIAGWRAGAQGIGEYAVEQLIRMFEYYDEWGLVGNPNVLGWLLRRQPRSFEEFFVRVARERKPGTP